jgi:hypothetical protein
MPFATSNDQKQNKNRFLLSPVALSIWTFSIGGKGVAVDGVSDNGGNVDSYISAPLSTASNNGLDLEPSNKRRDVDFGGLSKSCKSFANEPTV